MKTHRILGEPGTGSVLAECFFTLAGIPYEFEEVSYSEPGPRLERLLAVNPVRAVPAIELPDGNILTETVAIMIYAHDQNPQAKLIPEPSDPGRTQFWRWILFLATSSYPTFTYSDDPSRWVSNQEAQGQLRDSISNRQKELWQILEGQAAQGHVPDLLALNIFISVMTRWRPRREWIREHCPKLFERAEKIDQHPKLLEVWKTNFT